MTKTLDLREFPANGQMAQMELALPNIEAGEELLIVLDKDPTDLFQKFDKSKLVRSLQLKALEMGPEVWRIMVKAPNGHGDGGCCGSCGGH